MHHKHVTVTTHSRFFANNVSNAKSPMFFRQGSLQWNLPMFSTANVSHYTVVDVIIYDGDIESHRDHVQQFLQRCQE